MFSLKESVNAGFAVLHTHSWSLWGFRGNYWVKKLNSGWDWKVRLPVYHFLANFKRILNVTLSEDDNSPNRQKATWLLIIEMLSVPPIFSLRVATCAQFILNSQKMLNFLNAASIAVMFFTMYSFFFRLVQYLNGLLHCNH